MEVLQVKQFNAEAMSRWNEAVDKWHKDKFTHNIIPQIMMYGFRTRTGEMRKVGFVASVGNSHHYWAKTKKQAIANATACDSLK